MKFYISDAFTSAPFGGNTAGVAVLPENSDFPDDILMQNIAAELRYSETAFIRADGPQEFTIRYFTPKGEVDLCGHATIASFGVLRENGTVKDGDICINHTIAGDLNISIGNEVMMDMATPAKVIPAYCFAGCFSLINFDFSAIEESDYALLKSR